MAKRRRGTKGLVCIRKKRVKGGKKRCAKFGKKRK